MLYIIVDIMFKKPYLELPFSNITLYGTNNYYILNIVDSLLTDLGGTGP